MLSKNVSGFNQDARRQQELRLRPAMDAIYSDVLDVKFIKRDILKLDMVYSIDVVLRLSNGVLITGQEKALSYEYRHFESVTVEYMQNQHTEERGNWFTQIPQFYFVGYEAERQGSFCKFMMVNWLALISTRSLNWQDSKNENGVARASFRYIKFSDIPRRCIMATNTAY